MKFVPVTVSEKPELPAMADGALIAVIVGPTTVRAYADDVAPPGLCTVRLSLPAPVTKLAGTAAVMDVRLPPVTANAVVPE
jgi:hypothetical protein